MSYTISEAARIAGIAPTTIRYYHKEGLLPYVGRKGNNRVFEESDIRWLCLLNCLKNTGMPIKRIREYVELVKRGDASLAERFALIKDQRQFVQDQIEQLEYYMQALDFKEWYYKKAIALGSETAINMEDYERETGKCFPDNGGK